MRERLWLLLLAAPVVVMGCVVAGYLLLIFWPFEWP
jgi:hypothetical protein